MCTFASSSIAMTYNDQLFILLKLLAAMLLGGLLGFERERDGKAAGIRTYAAVCLGSALFTIIGIELMDGAGASRVVSNIVTGIGFLGAGIIFRDTTTATTSGLTTAATIWATAAVGVSVGYGLYFIAVGASLIIYFLLAMHHYGWFIRWTEKLRRKNDQDEQRFHHKN